MCDLGITALYASTGKSLCLSTHNSVFRRAPSIIQLPECIAFIWPSGEIMLLPLYASFLQSHVKLICKNSRGKKRIH